MTTNTQKSHKQALKKFFSDAGLFDRALTHRSWVNENKDKQRSNERLEFLGDAILEFVVSSHIYAKLPEREEGYLTALRANLVNTKNLARAAKRIGVGGLILLSKGEEDGGGRENPSLLADTMEAIIGAIFLDQGLKNATKFIEENVLYELEDKIMEPLKDSKSRLQEYVQAKGLPAPSYSVTKQSGPDHAKVFVIRVSSNGKTLGKGTGKNKSEGAQKAAEAALKKITAK